MARASVAPPVARPVAAPPIPVVPARIAAPAARPVAARGKPERFPALDAVRGLAAVAVVGFHAYKDVAGRFAGEGSPADTVLYSLDWAVVTFFVLSGFLLYTPFATALATGGERPSIRGFLWRRALRILPAYWLALVVFGSLAHPGQLWTVDGLLRYGLLQQIYSTDTLYHILGPAWTLAAEAAFYVALPLLAIGLAAAVGRIPVGTPLARHLAGLAALVLLAVAAVRIVLQPLYAASSQDPNLAFFSLPGTFPLFAGGMLLAVLYAHRTELVGLRRRVGRRGRVLLRSDATWLVLAGLAYLAGLRFEADHITPWHTTIGMLAAATCLLVPLVFRPQASPLARLLGGAPPLVGLGLVSYGLYLWHWPIQELTRTSILAVPHTWLGFATAFLAILAASLVPAWLSYRFLEAPVMRWGRRIVGSRPSPAPAAAAPPAPGHPRPATAASAAAALAEADRRAA